MMSIWKPGSALLLAALVLTRAADAVELVVRVQDSDGEPVQDAVVYLRALTTDAPPTRPSEPVIIDQIDKEYVPFVTAVQVGTSVIFPNRDQIRHHVYSFSEAKSFEIPLYEGTPADPIVFDVPGLVTLGCNIHDWMKAYVFVVDSPYFSVTDADGETGVDLPSGDYAAEVWHPELNGDPAALRQRISMSEGPSSLGFSIERKHVWNPRRAPSRGDTGGYR